MMRNRESPLPARMSSSFFCEGSGDMFRSRSATPNMPFIGVRISWLIIARNFALASAAASARWALRSASARAARILWTRDAANFRIWCAMAPATTDNTPTTKSAVNSTLRRAPSRPSSLSATRSRPNMATTLPSRSRMGAAALM